MKKNQFHQPLEMPSVDELVAQYNGVKLANIYLKRVVENALKAAGNVRKGSRDEREKFLHDDLRMRLARLSRFLMPTWVNATGVNVPGWLAEIPASDRREFVDFLLKGGSFVSVPGLLIDLPTEAEDLVCLLTGAQAAVVVNNRAAAFLLIADSVAQNREIIMSHQDFLEITSLFKVRNMMNLIKVKKIGSAKKALLKDYEAAVSKRTSVLFAIKRSGAVPVELMTRIAKERKIPFVCDCGETDGGLRMDVTSDVINQKPDLIFYGGKNMSGVQAGFVAGRSKWIEKMKAGPLIAAVRPDPMSCMTFVTMLKMHLREPSRMEAPGVESMDDIRQRAGTVYAALRNQVNIYCSMENAPESSVALALSSPVLSTEMLYRSLCRLPVPVIGNVKNGKVYLDFRMIAESEIAAVIQAVKKIIG